MAVKNFTKYAEFVSSQILFCLFLAKNASIFRNKDLGRKNSSLCVHAILHKRSLEKSAKKYDARAELLLFYT